MGHQAIHEHDTEAKVYRRLIINSFCAFKKKSYQIIISIIRASGGLYYDSHMKVLLCMGTILAHYVNCFLGQLVFHLGRPWSIWVALPVSS